MGWDEPRRHLPDSGLQVIRRVAAVAAGALLMLAGLPDAARAQVTFRDSTSAGVASAGLAHVGAGASATRNDCGSVAPAIPGGNNGDLLVALVNVRENSATVTMPGWTLLYADQYPGLTAAEEMKVAIYWRLATGGDPNTVTQAGTCSSLAAQVSRFSGVDASQPFENAPLPGASVARQNSGGLDTGTETTTLNGSMVIVAGFINDDRTVTQGAGWAQSFDSALNLTRDLSLSLHYQQQAAAGAASVSNWDLSGTGSDENYGIVIALRPAGLILNVPPATMAADVMIASIAARPDSAGILAPAGWILVRETAQPGGTPSRLATYYRVATAPEPASYTWTFAGAASGAAGGIASFSGVDTAAIVDAEGGNATASGTSHTANAVVTTVADAMLVASFEFASTPSDWNPPAGMTEAVDEGSIAPPSDAGIGIEMAYGVQPAAGGTGNKTATAAGVAADNGAAHLLALRPAGGPSGPGVFNAFETTTAAGAIDGVIRTRIAGVPFNLDVVVIVGGAQYTPFSNAVLVDLLGDNAPDGLVDSNNCPLAPTVVQTIAPNPTISGGRSTVSFAAVADSWKEVRVRVRWPTGSPTFTACSTDAFAIRPSALANLGVSHADWENPGTASALANSTFGAGQLHKAGRSFTVQAQALNGAGAPAVTANYAGAPNALLSACAGAACTPSFGNFTLGAAFAAGQLDSDAATYDEVGSFNLQLVDSTFAAVDSTDGTPADCSAAGRYVCSAAVSVGRFVPDHFAVALNSPVFATACAGGSFTYVGQSFGYTVQPVVTLQAQDATNAPTTLYTGAWWRVTGASLTGKAYSAAAGTLDASGVTGVDPVIADAGAGSGALTFSSGTGLLFSRSSPSAPFDAEVSLSINVADADNVAHGSNPVRFGQATAGNGIAFNNGKQMRFGRLWVASNRGSQLVPLMLNLELQHWNGTAFVTNTGDTCTTLAAGSIEMKDYTQALGACETSLTVSAFTGGRATARLSRPGGANTGSVTLVPHLEQTVTGSPQTCIGGTLQAVTGANRLYLEGKWDTTDEAADGLLFDDSPAGRATFGVYPGAREVIQIREIF
jgi:hypothetical protein